MARMGAAREEKPWGVYGKASPLSPHSPVDRGLGLGARTPPQRSHDPCSGARRPGREIVGLHGDATREIRSNDGGRHTT